MSNHQQNRGRCMLHIQNTKEKETVKTERKDATLASYSEKDTKWDRHRSQAIDVKTIYEKSKDFKKYGERIGTCADLLRFAWLPDKTTGELKLRLREARFCRVRYCTVCQWRRSLMQVARWKTAIPQVMAQYPKARWILLTLTVKNCEIENLRQTLKAMNEAWNRLRLRKDFKIVQGWVRSTEITKGENNSAHPHFHALLMIPPSYFNGKNYLSQSGWTDLWKECLRIDYTPIVDVRAVKDKKGGQDMDAAIEVLKYAVKPADLVDNADWLLELTKQTQHLRFLAAGGALKNAIKPEKKDEEDMIHTGDDKVPVDELEDTDEHLLAFDFRQKERRYRRAAHLDR